MNCEGAKLVLRCFCTKKWLKEKKKKKKHDERDSSRRVWRKVKHQKKLNKLSCGNWSIMPLQHINYQWWGTVCWSDTASPPPPPSFDVFTLWRYVYCYREYSYRENHFIKWNSYWCYHCFCICSSLLSFSSTLVQSLVHVFNLTSLPLLVMYCNETCDDVKGAG